MIRKALSALTLSLCLTLVATATPDNDLNTQLQTLIDKTATDYQLPAFSLSVQLPDSKPINVQYGVLEKGAPEKVDQASLFQMGGITKTFTAALILKLEQQGRLQLKDPLSKWLPEYSKWGDITIAQLLNQTSGLYDYSDSKSWWNKLSDSLDKVWTPQDLIKIAYDHDPYFAPGAGWHYSNTNYVLLGMIIEKITKTKLSEIISDKFALNKEYYLTHTFYSVDEHSPDVMLHMVHGYQGNDKDITMLNGSWWQGAGALISAPDDMVKWLALLFNDKVISLKQVDKMTTFVSLKDGKPLTDFAQDGYGMGIFTMNTPHGVMWFAPGLTPGYQSFVARMPCSGVIISYATNNMDKKGFNDQVLKELMTAVFDSATAKSKISAYRSRAKLPEFCKISPARKFEVPKV